MHVVVGGASGFLGQPLVAHLRTQGHQVTRLIRSGEPGDDASLWNPAAGRIDQVLIDRADAVINLSGSPISQWPRTPKRKRVIRSSRLECTSTLAAAIARSSTPTIFLSGSGMSWYGVDRGTEALTEADGPGEGFLADVSQEWEAAAQPAVDAGARTCFLRTSLVLDSDGGVLSLMLPAWKLGGGARLGSGDQYMSLITRADWIRGVTHLLDADISGPVNLAMPAAVTNAQYTDALGDAVNRPTFLVAPAFAVRAVLGGLSDDLLGSLQVVPAALTGSGFTFEADDLSSALAHAIH
ncbi:TIGR01777 family oxidoreductase [Aeromicrobium sp. CF3.5]|uniref:TIGR01777 family oxidoreductase n=1 Tax=Aeromicrobium sp. CF3.5 TaxID=3373078 RepID=UPI003EE752B8